jgi:hypothetical protein
LTRNNFQKLQKDPTSKYQQNITKALQHSNLIVQKKKTNQTAYPEKTQTTLPRVPDQNTQTGQPYQARGKQHMCTSI